MQIEVGKYYRTRDGQKVQIHEEADNEGAQFYSKDCGLYFADGTFGYGETTRCPEQDLIAEWTEALTGHVRTVTRKEIVPGVYGNVIVWNDGSGDVSVMNMRTAPELRAAVATLSEIADALEGGAV
jgi:hypothetical protein